MFGKPTRTDITQRILARITDATLIFVVTVWLSRHDDNAASNMVNRYAYILHDNEVSNILGIQSNTQLSMTLK